MKACVITGVAGGIGLALARRYGAGGYAVFGVDYDEAGLERAREVLAEAGIVFQATQGDLTSAEDRAAIVEWLCGLGRVHTFIHNAGINVVGAFEDIGDADHRRVIAVNLAAPIDLTRSVLALKLIPEGGRLIYLSSLSYYVGYPGATVYAASKDGLASFASSMRAALGKKSIGVLTVFPGPTRTPMARDCSPEGAGNEESRMRPERLADLIYRASHRGARVLIPGASNRAFAMAGRLFPALTEVGMRRAIFDRLERGANARPLSSDRSR